MQEIVEGNKLIAEFMGYKYIPFNPETPNLVCGWWKDGKIGRNFLCRTHKQLPYRNSFTYLMEVIDKIEDLDDSKHYYQWEMEDGMRSNFICYEFDISRYSCEVYLELELDPAILIAGDYNKKYPTRIEAAFWCVVEFIKWRNERYKKRN